MAKRKRAGRPTTQNVQRYACGKIRKEYATKRGETEAQIMATVLDYRARNGVAPDHLRRNEAGYALGRMYLAGKVTPRQHRAGCDYALLVGDYQRSIGFPAPYPQGMDLGAARGLSLGSEPSDASVRRVKDEYMGAEGAGLQAGKAAMSAIREACIYDREVEDVENLRIGLDALGDFFRIPR